ncbi:MAG: xanthine dehydrogenase accessory protein XdhC [Candidatus Melainabacteria bacterium]|jgi:xanthine dehydrogenase accessory factor|nr:xanthine dehydrogenase accessory protein XdhC [Candidatus Melainabacteria bacterium]
MITFYERMSDLFAEGTPFVCATIVDTQGSVPADVGAKMLVTADGAYFGTVGGGKIENRVIQEAKAMLKAAGLVGTSGKEDAIARFFEWSLNRDIGMTCGGSMRVYLEAFNHRAWNITIFGAGHVGNALINLLNKLDCRITCVDSRVEWLDKLPESAKIRRVLLSEMKQFVPEIPRDSFVLLMTMGHSSDKPILLEILQNWKDVQFPYVGVIGSDAKAARLRKDIAEAGLPDELSKVYYCPIGLALGSNHPQEIAVSVTAQLLQVRDAIVAASASVDADAEAQSSVSIEKS